jgi:hypothetical protein
MSVPLKLVHISFGAGVGAPIDPKVVEYVVNTNAIEWMRYLNNCYVVCTHLELAAWTNIFRSIPNMEKGYFFIVAIDPESALEGWLPPWAWEWLRKFRHHYAPAPSLQEPFDFSGLSGLLGDPGKKS